MAALTDECPKPLLEVGAESLIERHLRRLAEAGIAEVVVNLSYNGEMIRDKLGDGARWNLAIRYSEEGPSPLETGGGIINALPLLGSEPFLLVNADVITDFDFSELRLVQGQGVLVLVPNPPHHSRGDFGLDSKSMLSANPPKWTFAGISLLDTELFGSLKPERRALKPILDDAINRGLLYGVRYDGLWLDVGTPARLERARSLFSRERV